MEQFMSGLSAAIGAFFSFKAYVILPVIMLLLAVLSRLHWRESLMAAIRIGAGFAGVFIVFAFFVSQISPAVKAIIEVRGLNFPVVDVGWPPLAAITWSSMLAPLSIPMVMGLNVLMLWTRTTRTLYIDLWNYWHFAFLGALLASIGTNIFLAIAAILVIAVYNIKVTEWTAPYVKRELGLDGIAISPLSVAGLLPYAFAVNQFFNAVPGLRRLNWNPSRKVAVDDPAQPVAVRLLREPMVIGFLVGVFLSLMAAYDLRRTLETSVNIAAVMFILPRCGGLIGEGMGAVAMAFKGLVERRFKGMGSLSIAMDTGILMTNQSVIATGLILIPVSVLIAFVLPGNRVIPLGDLPNLMSIMSVVVLVMGGNVVRSVLAGIPVVASFLLISSVMAGVFTSLAAATGLQMSAGGQEITAFTDGGNQVRYLLYWLFQGNLLAVAIIPVVLLLMWVSWRQYRRMLRDELENTAAPAGGIEKA